MDRQPSFCDPLPKWRNGKRAGSACLQIILCVFSFFFFFISLNSIYTELRRKKEEEKIFFKTFTQEGPVAGFPMSPTFFFYNL